MTPELHTMSGDPVPQPLIVKYTLSQTSLKRGRRHLPSPRALTLSASLWAFSRRV